MKFIRLALPLLALVASSLAAEPPKPILDCFISTGDCHWVGSWLPIDSKASIEASFELLKQLGVRRVYWRGLEEATWMDTFDEREENCRYSSWWKWCRQIYREVDPDKVAVEAAHRRGMEIWGVATMFDWGSAADTPCSGDFPHNSESRLRLKHPEWVPVDRSGVLKQGGPIELAYPEARRALVDLHTKFMHRDGYDGMIFVTYAENYSTRFQDEFGFNEPIVQEFKKRTGLDIRTKPFTRMASRDDWYALRGQYVTAYLRELKTELAKSGKKLGLFINPGQTHFPQPWNVPELLMTGGHIYFDLETWVREGIVDEFIAYGSSAMQLHATEDLLWLTRQTKTSVSALTSSPFAGRWKPFHDRGVATALAVGEEDAYLDRCNIPDQPIEALRGKEDLPRLKALSQIVHGKLKATVADLAPVAKDANLLVRRMTLLALGKSKDPQAVSIIEQALEDPENGVRCMAAEALRESNRPESVAKLLAAVDRFGAHPLMESVVVTLMKMQPFPRAELATAASESRNPMVRTTAMRAFRYLANEESVPMLAKGLDDPDRYVRFAAAEALGNIPRSTKAAEALIAATRHGDPVVADRAATSLGAIAARRAMETEPLRPAMLDALKNLYAQFGAASQRTDADWGYRPAGNALLKFGPDGERVLQAFMDQRDDMRLAEFAWKSLWIRQDNGTFSEVTEKENDEAFKHRPEKKSAGASPAPTLGDVPYGPDPQQRLDFYKAQSSKPAPLVFFIHGGAWVGGDKIGNGPARIADYLTAGISVVSVDYRFIAQAQAAGIQPPVQWPLRDAARALQFVRTKAAEWNIDKQRIAVSGESAGASSGLWLAFHPDLADPNSADPIARESTRPFCAAVVRAQTTLDPLQMKEWTPNSNYGGHAFGFTGDVEKRISRFDEFLAKRDSVLPWITEYSPYALATAGAPPIYLLYLAPPALGQPEKDPVHTANFGVKLEEKLRSVGVECELVYPGAPGVKHAQMQDYLIAKLKASATRAATNFYVDPEAGSDTADGHSPESKGATGPFKTIARAIAAAGPGDTVHLAPTTYTNECVEFRNKSGEPGRPITLDGHGAVIDGSDPLIERDWQQVSPGLYRNTALYAKPLASNAAFTARFGLVMNGHLNRMGRSAKGRCDPYKPVADLRNGEWTYQADDGHSYYLKIDPATTLASHAIRVPTRVTAVEVYGSVSHLVIRNITGRHVINDGFGITTGSTPNDINARVRDILFENIKAVECCDDGLSSHADCELRVDGFEVDGCATAIANCGSDTIDHLVTRNIHGMDLLFYGGRHILQNSHIHAHGNAAALSLTTQFGNAKWLADPARGALYEGWDHCVVQLKNVILDGSQYPAKDPGKVLVANRCTLEASSATMSGLTPAVANDGSLKFADKALPALASVNGSRPAAAKTDADWPAPALANIHYGPHERQVLDFYKSGSAQPTPLLIFIHGGGWVTGDKSLHGILMQQCLAAGISVVSINYRFTWEAQLAGVKPPVEWPLHDAARALQFVRSKSAEWNIDRQRIATTGGSAGGCSSLWLALHDDLADPKSSDPIARESTRLWCAAATGAQTSLDPRQLVEWTPNSTYGGHAFGFMDPKNINSRDRQFAEFLAARDQLLPWITEYSPIEHASADDPPIFLLYNDPPALGQPQKDPTHTANYGVKLQEKLRSLGRECELDYSSTAEETFAKASNFLIEKLKATKK